MTWTRVKDEETGHEYSTLVVRPGMHVLENKDAADAYGQPLPPKHNRPLSTLTDADGTKVASMTVPQLQSFATRNGVEVPDDAKKDDLLTAIAAHEGDDYTKTTAPDPGDGDPSAS